MRKARVFPLPVLAAPIRSLWREDSEGERGEIGREREGREEGKGEGRGRREGEREAKGEGKGEREGGEGGGMCKCKHQ